MAIPGLLSPYPMGYPAPSMNRLQPMQGPMPLLGGQMQPPPMQQQMPAPALPMPGAPQRMAASPGLTPAQNQIAGAQRNPFLSGFLPAFATGFGAALAADNPAAGIPAMQQFAQTHQQRIERQRELAEQGRQRNATVEFLRKKGRDDLIGMVQNGSITPAQAMAEATNAERSGSKYGMTPIYGTDAEGRTRIGVIGPEGTFKPIETGDFDVSSGVEKIDAGSYYILVDKRTGSRIGTLPKENYQEAFDKSAGSEAGKASEIAKGEYQSIQSKMPGLEFTVSQLKELSDKATYTASGQLVDTFRRQTGQEPRESAIAREQYIAIVNNQILPLLRDTFGAQFTEREGESLKATLGNPNLAPAEKQAVLESFIAQKRRDVEALAARAGIQQSTSEPTASDAGRDDPLGIRR